MEIVFWFHFQKAGNGKTRLFPHHPPRPPRKILQARRQASSSKYDTGSSPPPLSYLLVDNDDDACNEVQFSKWPNSHEQHLLMNDE